MINMILFYNIILILSFFLSRKNYMYIYQIRTEYYFFQKIRRKYKTLKQTMSTFQMKVLHFTNNKTLTCAQL